MKYVTIIREEGFNSKTAKIIPLELKNTFEEAIKQTKTVFFDTLKKYYSQEDIESGVGFDDEWFIDEEFGHGYINSTEEGNFEFYTIFCK